MPTHLCKIDFPNERSVTPHALRTQNRMRAEKKTINAGSSNISAVRIEMLNEGEIRSTERKRATRIDDVLQNLIDPK